MQRDNACLYISLQKKKGFAFPEKAELLKLFLDCFFYAPNFGKVEGAYCFRQVYACVCLSITKFIKIQF